MSTRPRAGEADQWIRVATTLLARPPIWSRWPFPRPSVAHLATVLAQHPADPGAVIRTLEAAGVDPWAALRDALWADLPSLSRLAHREAVASWIATQGLRPVYPIGRSVTYAGQSVRVVGHDLRAGRYELAEEGEAWISVPYEALHPIVPPPERFALRPDGLGDLPRLA